MSPVTALRAGETFTLPSGVTHTVESVGVLTHRVNVRTVDGVDLALYPTVRVQVS